MSEEQYVKSELGDGIVMTSTTPLTKEDHLRNIAKLRQIIDEKNAIHARKRNTSSQQQTKTEEEDQEHQNNITSSVEEQHPAKTALEAVTEAIEMTKKDDDTHNDNKTEKPIRSRRRRGEHGGAFAVEKPRWALIKQRK